MTFGILRLGDAVQRQLRHPEPSSWSHKSTTRKSIRNKKLLNKKITTIAYPYGSYNTDTINITKSAFDYAVTVESGFNYSNKLDRLRLKRFKIPRSMDINTFINVIEGK